MTRVLAALAASLAFACMVAASSAQQTGEPRLEGPNTAIPVYQITFKEREPVKGVGAAPAFRLPFHCSSDGTVFITTIQPVLDGAQAKDARTPGQPLLVSVSPSGEAHSFPLNRIGNLFDVHQIGETESDSRVAFLVSAAPEEGSVNGHDHDPSASAQGAAKDRSERHDYLVTFDREGNHQKTTELRSAFRITDISAFSSGSFLAYGYDVVDHSPKLAMLKDDGSFLKPLEIPKGEAPESVLGTKDASGKGPSAYLTPIQLTPQGQYIYFLQADSDYPVLRVSVGGAIDAIKPKLPVGATIAMLIPSDENLYAIIHTANAPGKPPGGAVLELSAQEGLALRELRLGNDESAYGLACVHDKKFLLFHHGDGRLVPLVGTADPRE
jgi:hypothetical protein